MPVPIGPVTLDDLVGGKAAAGLLLRLLPTEVVLQGFNAALTLLDPKSAGTSSQHSEEVTPPYGKTTPTRAPASPPRTDWTRKPDDEIPF
jgi:hypothetical protein